MTFYFSTEICAASPEGLPKQGICHGDSGGPLHVKENGRWSVKLVIKYTICIFRYTQVGVVSGTGSCKDPKIPSVYIRVGEANINKWIKEETTGTKDSNC